MGTPQQVGGPPPAPPPATEPATPRWKVAVEVVGAAAGATALLFVVGGILVAARLEGLNLPVSGGVALLPTSVLAVTAIKAIGLSLLAAAALLALVLPLAFARREAKGAIATICCGAVAAAGLSVTLSAQPPQLAVVAGVAISAYAAVVAAVLLNRDSAPARVALVVVGTALVVGPTLQVLAALAPSGNLEYASVRLRSGERVDGYFIARTSSAIYVAPNVDDRVVGNITAIPEKDIASVALDNLVVAAKPLDVDAEAGVPPALSEEGEGAVRERVLTFLATMRADPTWLYPPVVPSSAVTYLIDNFKRFDDLRHHPFPSSIARPARLADVLTDPHLFLAEEFTTSGIVVFTRPYPSQEGTEQTYMVLRTRRGASAEAGCTLTPADGVSVRAGTRVKVRAMVLAWGTYRDSRQRRFNDVVFSCAAVKPVRAPARRRGH